jgi:hypothetical protein
MANNRGMVFLSILGWTLVLIISLGSLIGILVFPNIMGVRISELGWYNLFFVCVSPIVCVYLIIVNIRKLKSAKQKK